VHAPPAVPTERVGGSRPGVRRAAVLVTVLVCITILRPWGDSSGRAAPDGTTADPAALDASTRPAAVAPAEATARPEPSLAADQVACGDTSWQLVSLDRLATWTVRTWVPAAAVMATGPLDPDIRMTRLDSPEVLALGACGPADPDMDGDHAGSGGPTQAVAAWRIADGRATPVTLVPGRVETTPGVATLYRPAAAAAGSGPEQAWPAGTYVLQVIRVGDAGATARPASWFLGLDVRSRG